MALVAAMVLLAVLWAIGFLVLHLGIYIHVLLVAAIVVAGIRFYRPTGSPY